jgi:hypothetical protein
MMLHPCKIAKRTGSMLVFYDQKLAFLATPKTGSTAIETALESLSAVVIQRPPILKHTSVQRFHRFLGPYLEVASGTPFTVCALMREPRDWLGSWYRYRQRDDVTDPRKVTLGKSFDDFVAAYCSADPPDFAAVGSQSRFLKARKGKGVDHLFRYEDIDSFVIFLEDRLDCEINLPRLNVSPPGTLELSSATQAKLNTFLADDFELYNSITSQ